MKQKDVINLELVHLMQVKILNIGLEIVVQKSKNR